MSASIVVEQTTEQTRWVFTGELNQLSVPALWQQAQQLLGADSLEQSATTSLRFDLSSIERADSAGVAFLVACYGKVQQQNKHLQLDQVPTQLQALIDGTDLTNCLLS